MVDRGTTTDECVPYKSGSSGMNGRCPDQCVDGSEIKLTKSTSTVDVCSGEESIKNALTHGTVQF